MSNQSFEVPRDEKALKELVSGVLGLPQRDDQLKLLNDQYYATIGHMYNASPSFRNLMRFDAMQRRTERVNQLLKRKAS